jgi:hypothetical protein
MAAYRPGKGTFLKEAWDKTGIQCSDPFAPTTAPTVTPVVSITIPASLPSKMLSRQQTKKSMMQSKAFSRTLFNRQLIHS